MTTLNLGCGNKIVKGATNHDLHKHRDEVDIVWDLNETPWPWGNDEFDEIHAISVFEHLKIDLIETLNECWRILKSGGTLHIKFPLYTSANIHNDPTHRWHWSSWVLDFVDPSTKFGSQYKFYTSYKWKIVSKKTGKKGWNCFATLTPRKEKK